MKVLPSETFFLSKSELSRFYSFSPRHVDRPKCCWTRSSLSHWASAFVCSRLAMTQRVARVRMRQLRLVTADAVHITQLTVKALKET